MLPPWLRRGSGTLAVSTDRFEEIGEPGADGYPTYHYSGLIYRFRMGSRHGGARRYDEDPQRASINGFFDWSRPWSGRFIPRRDPFLRAIVAFLLTEPGVEEVSLLLRRGYVTIARRGDAASWPAPPTPAEPSPEADPRHAGAD
ncbi:hypothetical protein [Roseomonas sp. BN140053]|uniref:hypothetical protein n=1 Tax=Roseomonas sp. BN140053 TaxID=3391898 RepID=UPI0039E8482E